MFQSVFAGSILPRLTQPTPVVLCDNTITLFDYKGVFVTNPGQSTIEVEGLTKYTNYSTLNGQIKVTIAIKTSHHNVTNAPIIEIGIWPENTSLSSINWTPSNALQSGVWGGNHTTLKVSSSFYDAGGNKISDNPVTLSVSRGWQPAFTILKNGETTTEYSNDWLTKLSTGCTDDKVYIYAPNLKCASDEFKLSVQELEYNQQTRSFSGVNQEYYLFGGLNTNEKNWLSTQPGLDITSIVADASRSQNGSTISFQADKYYVINLIYADQGKWYPSYKYIQINGENWDLVLKDNETDNGAEPIDVWTRNVFKSPDLWNRLNDGTTTPTNYTTHEDPDYVDVSGHTNRMFYRVTNIGCAASPADMPLRLFWTRARTNELWDQHWLYDMNNNKITDNGNIDRPLGSEITIPNPVNDGTYGTVTPASIEKIPSIAAGGVYVPEWADGVDWFPPNNAWYDYATMSTDMAWTQDDKHNIICLLGKINESTNDLPISPPPVDPIVWQPVVGDWKMPTIPVGEFVANNNNVNTRNSTLTANSVFLVDHGNGDWDYGYGTVMVNNPTNATRNVNLCINLIDNGYTTTFADYGDIYVGITNELWASWVTNGATAVTNATVAEPGLFLATSGTRVCINDIDVAPGSVEQIGVRFLYDGNSQLPSVAERYYYELEEIDRSENQQPTSKTVYITDVPTTSPVSMQTKRTLDKLEESAANKLAINAYPNPARDLVVIGLLCQKDAPYKLDIIDFAGKTINTIEANAEANYISKALDIKGYRAGVYTIALTSNGNTVYQKLVIYN